MVPVLRILGTLLVFLCTAPAFSTLPDAVTTAISKKHADLEMRLSNMHQEQHRLLLDRLVDLMLESRLFVGLKIDREELKAYVDKRFVFRTKAIEAPTKKGKALNVFDEKAEKYLSLLLERFAGNPRGDIVDLNFTCGGHRYELPFDVIDDEDSLRLTLYGVEVPQEPAGLLSNEELLSTGREGHSDECLAVSFDYDTKGAEVLSLASKKAACPLPAAKGGECLLSIAESISRALGSDKLELVDDSTFKCRTNKEVADYRKLMTFQEGRGWYEKHGFQPDFRDYDDNEGTAKSEAERVAELSANLRAFVNYRLSSLLNNVKRIPQNSFSKPDAKNLFIQKAEPYLALHKEGTAAQFMSWLWKEDCVSYIEIDKYVFVRSAGLEITRLYSDNDHFVKFLR